jgi:hypothetical protein
MGVQAAATNVTQAMILSSIIDASNEVDLITHTTYHSIEDSGTATSGAATTLTDSGQAWTVDEYINYVVWIHAGTGNGQYREITSNTATALTVATWGTNPDATSEYRIIPDCILDLAVDGDGSQTLSLEYFPITNLQSLDIDSVSVTPSKVYKYADEGILELNGKLGPEVNYFSDTHPQSIEISWVYGVYPIPRDVIRLTASLAAIECLVTQIGGTYNDVTSYTIPHLTVSKGEPYMNIRSTLDYLRKEADKLIQRIVKYPAMF